MKPTATIYQNETNVYIIFSKVDGTFHGSSTSFENDWSDGGACGVSGFETRKELNDFIKENHLKKRGIVSLELYCWSKHTVKFYKGQVHGGTSTCMLKLNHKSKHKGMMSTGFPTPDKEIEWK